MAYQPEQSWNYEGGLHTALFNHRLKADLTFFYMDISDIQLTRIQATGRVLGNAGKAESYGAELSLRALLSNEWSADLNYGFTNATFRDYAIDSITNYKGNYIPYATQHTLSLGLRYLHSWQACWLDRFTASAQYSGNGKIYWTEKNDLYQPFYGVLNAKAGVQKGKVAVNLWGRNLSNASYAAFGFESSGSTFMQKGRPLQAGIEVVFTL
jgi:outer membrane receptor protein involved in Fe transport